MAAAKIVVNKAEADAAVAQTANASAAQKLNDASVANDNAF